MKSERSLKVYGFSHFEFHFSKEISASTTGHNFKEQLCHSIDSIVYSYIFFHLNVMEWDCTDFLNNTSSIYHYFSK